MPGPPPKREAERRRRNKDVVEIESVDIASLIAEDVVVPNPDPDWDPIAKMVWESSKRSGQAIFYEPSDWATLYLMCESISRDLDEQVVGIDPTNGQAVYAKIPLKGASLSAYLKLMGSLMMTEGDRRKLRVELERQKAKDALLGSDNVVSIVQDRASLFER